MVRPLSRTNLLVHADSSEEFVQTLMREMTMNNERRKLIQQALEYLQNAQVLIEDVRDREQDAYDNMPEGFQNGERGEKAMSAVDALESTLSDMEGVFASLEEAAA